jgi:hypothetical protein
MSDVNEWAHTLTGCAGIHVTDDDILESNSRIASHRRSHVLVKKECDEEIERCGKVAAYKPALRSHLRAAMQLSPQRSLWCNWQHVEAAWTGAGVSHKPERLSPLGPWFDSG